MTIITHVAKNRASTLCGEVIPETNGVNLPVAGSRVGITKGKFTFSSYVVGQNDSNPACPKCLPIHNATAP